MPKTQLNLSENVVVLILQIVPTTSPLFLQRSSSVCQVFSTSAHLMCGAIGLVTQHARGVALQPGRKQRRDHLHHHQHDQAGINGIENVAAAKIGSHHSRSCNGSGANLWNDMHNACK